MMRTEEDGEQSYWNSLPKCCWCEDAIQENEGQECERCNAQACIDHCSTALNGEIVCLQCKSDEHHQIRRFATGENLLDLLKESA